MVVEEHGNVLQCEVLGERMEILERDADSKAWWREG
jgi:hypothetical protein